MIRDFAQDVRLGFRQLWLHPRISLTILIFLAIGSGVNCAVFTLVDAILLKPPDHVDPRRTVLVSNHYTDPANDRAPLSPPAVDDVTREIGIFQAVGAYSREAYELNGGDEPERIYGAGVSAGFFSAFGAKPLLGRAFLPEEQVAGRNQVAILSADLWRSHFGSDPKVLDHLVILNGSVYRVVGVLPADLKFPPWAEIWTPLALDHAGPTYNRENEYLTVVALLHPGVHLIQAQARVAALAHGIAAANPGSYPVGSGFGMNVEPLRGVLVKDSRAILLLLFAAVSCVLLITCANTATLLLVQAIARGSEIAVRAAVGATRWRLVRQLLTESLVPALLGGLAGLLLAQWLIRWLLRLLPFHPPGAERIGIDARVLVYTLGVSIVSGILSGLAPAIHTFRSRLETGTESAGPGIRGRRLLGGLAAVQIALTFVLLAATVLLAQSFGRLTAIDPGFDPRGVLTLKINPPRWRYKENAQYMAFYELLLRELRGVPDARMAGTTSIVPMTSGSFSLSFVPQGKTARAEEPKAEVRVISPDYFQAMRIRLQAGRGFDLRDRENAEPVVVVDRALAERIWPGEVAIGKKLSLGSAPAAGPWRTVVGVVTVVKDARLSDPPSPHLYLPFAQYPMRNLNLAVRARRAAIRAP
jgi:putative ABC transport system permease protein